MLDFSQCQALITIDASNNNFTGAVRSPSGNNLLYSVNLQDNSIDMEPSLDALIAGKHIINLNINNNR